MNSCFRNMLALSTLVAGLCIVSSSSAQNIPLALFDAPNATPDSFTSASGVNDAGVIVGSEDSTGSPLGFIRAGNGTFTSFAVPGAGFTVLGDINNGGQMTGQFGPADFSVRHGFFTTGAVVTAFDVPGASKTLSFGINDNGLIVGNYFDAGNVRHGFLRNTGGLFTSIDIPGAAAVFAYGINNGGQIVGAYQTADLTYHGYLRAPAGGFTFFDAPGASFTSAHGINDLGEITGGTDGAGFVREANGTYRFLDTPAGFNQPTGNGINNRGVIVGDINDDFTTHAFYTAAVPEPGTLALLVGLGGAGGGLFLRRRRKEYYRRERALNDCCAVGAVRG